MRFPLPALGLQVGNDDDLELQALGLVDGHQLHAAVAAGGGVGQCGELVESGVEAGPSRSCSPAGRLVEAAPEQVEVGAGRGVDAVCAAQAQPDLFEPGSRHRRGLASARSVVQRLAR